MAVAAPSIRASAVRVVGAVGLSLLGGNPAMLEPPLGSRREALSGRRPWTGCRLTSSVRKLSRCCLSSSFKMQLKNRQKDIPG